MVAAGTAALHEATKKQASGTRDRPRVISGQVATSRMASRQAKSVQGCVKGYVQVYVLARMGSSAGLNLFMQSCVVRLHHSRSVRAATCGLGALCLDGGPDLELLLVLRCYLPRRLCKTQI